MEKNIETSLYAPWEQVVLLVDDIDYWYVDIKDIDEERYKQYTGKSNKQVLSNLKKLVDAVGAEKVCVRVPLIPKYNTKENQEEAVAYIQENISNEVAVDVFEYIRC